MNCNRFDRTRDYREGPIHRAARSAGSATFSGRPRASRSGHLACRRADRRPAAALIVRVAGQESKHTNLCSKSITGFRLFLTVAASASVSAHRLGAAARKRGGLLTIMVKTKLIGEHKVARKMSKKASVRPLMSNQNSVRPIDTHI